MQTHSSILVVILVVLRHFMLKKKIFLRHFDSQKLALPLTYMCWDVLVVDGFPFLFSGLHSF